MAPPFFFLLCWLLRTAISGFPEEPGPLNFIPTEGTDPLHLSSLAPPALHIAGVGGHTGTYTKGVDWCQGQEVWDSHSGMRLGVKDTVFLTFPHACSSPQETQFLLHSDLESPYQLGGLQVRSGLDWLQFNNIESRLPCSVQSLLDESVQKTWSVSGTALMQLPTTQ